MRSNEVRYHKSNEDLDHEHVKVKPLTVGYCRFTILERVLLVAVSVIFIIALVFLILYASVEKSSKNDERNEEKNSTTQENSITTSVEGNEEKNSTTQEICLTPECIMTSAEIIKSIEWKADPCQDFYKFACSRFLDSHEIPASQTSFGQWTKLAEQNMNFIRRKLENQKELKKYRTNEAVWKALKDYSSCMKAEKTESGSVVKQAHSLIRQFGSCNVTDPDWKDSNWQLMTHVVNIHRNLSLIPLFINKITEDLKNSSNYIVTIAQTGSFFITREGYLGNASYYRTVRTRYKDLMLKVITKLANTTKDDPVVSRQVNDIFNFERQLAEISMTYAQFRKREENYKKISLKDLQKYTGDGFNWLDYFRRLFQGIDIRVDEEMIIAVTQLDYLRNMSKILGKTDDVVLGNYLIWNVMCSMGTLLGKPFRNYFQEYYKQSQGTSNGTPRWKFCLGLQRTLQLPLSTLYVDEKFGKNQMEHIEEMVSGIREVFVENLQNIKWMDKETKKMALRKARAIKENIGYPKILLDVEKMNKLYEELEIDENDYFGNILRKRAFASKQGMKLLLQPVDKSEWSFPPYVTNAVYKPTENKIIFPAGILQPPFFDATRPKSLNFGAIGMIIGHELTHSFDNRGRHYDEHGNLVDWWKNSSVHEFKTRAKCLERKYSGYTFHKLKINGRNTLDENIADNGGIKQSFQAYRKWTKIHGLEKDLPGLNITHSQLFFIGYSQMWCTKYREAVIPRIVKRQGHAPDKIRIIGPLSNFPEFSKAFNCRSGSRMNPRDKCDVW